MSILNSLEYDQWYKKLSASAKKKKDLKVYVWKFRPRGVFGTPISFLGFMSTSYDYQIND